MSVAVKASSYSIDVIMFYIGLLVTHRQMIQAFFRNKFNKFNNTAAQIMLDSIYHMTLKLLCSPIFGVKTLRFCQYVPNVFMDIITCICYLICKPLVVYQF